MRTLFTLFAAFMLMGNTIKEQAWALMEEGKEAEAFALVKDGAKDKDAESIDYLAWFYDQGRHVERDMKRAEKLYREAAELGVPHAQWRLGVLIDEGAVKGSKEDAFALFQQAAGQNFSNAMTSLAVMYATGRGTAQDHEAAKFYYSMAAAAGNPHAVQGLGVLYILGEGVEKDPVEAAAYFLLASSLGSESGEANFRRSRADLSAEDLARATARASELGSQFGFEGSVTIEKPERRNIRQKR